MVSQDIEHALLAAILAVRQGLVTPGRAAAIVGTVAEHTNRSWFEIAAECQELDRDQVSALETQFTGLLQENQGEAGRLLLAASIQPQFQAALERLNLGHLMEFLPRPAPSTNAPETGATTAIDDRYATLKSNVERRPETVQDPYITGASANAWKATPSPDPSQLPGTNLAPFIESHAPTSNGAGPVSAATAPTQPEQHSLPSASDLDTSTPVNYETRPSVIPELQPLSPPSTPADTEYTTLQSGVSHTGPRPPTAPSPQDFPSWPLRFRVLREHAKGGLGKVSVAEDLELHREVAFKEIQRNYADDAEARSRFLLEAEITGGLEHPGIVPVYGLGTHADGRPYYAMRFIRGRSLQQAIEHYFRSARDGMDPGALQLEFRQLLRRFIDVCNAIDYAHNRGVLHRDLKPGNVMLGDYGETLVVDWGLAKSVSVTGSLFRHSLEPLTPRTIGDSSQTMMGVAIGTPQFMSPEQAQGQLDQLGPASDVYSLGATLYCLLTGVAAFTSRDLNTVLKQVKEGIFPPPIQVNPKIPKPLDAICLKAMQRLPALRYGSARALAEDIEHWLADEPVLAYSENRWEQINRWVRRHQAKAQAIAATVIVVALVSTVAAILIDQSRRAEARALAKLTIANQNEIAAHQQETLAKQEALRRSRQTREAIDTLLTGMSDALDSFPGMQEARRRLLERAAQDYTRLADEKSSDPELRLEAARSVARLGDVYAKLNDTAKARDAFTRAENLMQNTIQPAAGASQDSKLEEALVRTRHALFEAASGDHQRADVQFQNAIASLQALVIAKPDELSYQDALGTALIGLGQSQLQAGQSAAAGRNLQRGLMLFQQLRVEHRNNVRVLTAAAAAQTAFARYLMDSAQAVEAVKLFEDAIRINDDLVAEFPQEPDYLAQRAAAEINLAESQRSLGYWPTVVRNYQSSIADLQEVVRARPDVPRFRENLAVARTNLGQALRRLGDNTAAIPVLEKSLENFDELSASFPIPRYVDGVGNTRTSLAQVLSELGDQDRALELINAAMDDYRELLDLDPEAASYLEGLGIVQSNRGRILARRGDVTEGLKAFDDAVASLEAALEKEPKSARITDQLAWAWTHRGQVLFAAGQNMPSQEAFSKGLALRHKLANLYPESPLYRDSLAWLLATCPVNDLRDGKRAGELAEQILKLAPDSTQYWRTLAAASMAKGNRVTALEAINKSLHFRNHDDGISLCLRALAESKSDPGAAQKSLELARAYHSAQKPADEELGYWIKQTAAALPPQ